VFGHTLVWGTHTVFTINYDFCLNKLHIYCLLISNEVAIWSLGACLRWSTLSPTQAKLLLIWSNWSPNWYLSGLAGPHPV